MLTSKAGESGAFNPYQLKDIAMNVVETACDAVSRPLDIIIRPFHGSRYFSIVVIFLSNVMMILLPFFSAMTRGALSMIPLVHISPPIGLFGIGSLAKLYFLLSLIHGIRIYRLMIHPEMEKHSEFEGPPLPFFYLLPKSSSFWFTRLVWEPLFVFVTATVLGHMFIFQSGLVIYLYLAAMALAMKAFIGWYRSWEYIRNILDTKFAGPIIAKIVDNTATAADLAPLHMTSFPKDLPEDIRKAAASHIAHALSRDDQ